MQYLGALFIVLVQRSYEPLWYLSQRLVTTENNDEFGAENIGLGKWILERRLVPRGKEYTRPVGSGKPISLIPVIGAHKDESAELDIILKSNIHKICFPMFVLPRRGRHSLQRLALSW
jgi:hypothetical protein